jgi:DNA-binding CsgD family transcriptional regulator
MIWDNPVLDRIVELETFAEIVARLTPAETAVAVLRADGLSDQEIADALGITRAAVHERIKKAVKRISRQVPEAGHLLAGRDRFNTASRCLTIPAEQETLSAPQAAEVLNCTTACVRNWIAAGRFPNAQQAPTGRWRIPWSDLEGLP